MPAQAGRIGRGAALMRFWPRGWFGRTLLGLAQPSRSGMTAPGRPGVIYDVGMNNGDDCAYYLKKGFAVVAMEANPALCDAASRRFEAAIAAGSLTILNLGIADFSGAATFYVHRTNSVLSTFVKLEDRVGYTGTLPEDEFTPIQIATRRLSDVVADYGAPHYVKIDIEGFDARCLADLRRAGMMPAYISAEAHTIETYYHLVAMGYRKFKMVAGETVQTDYAAHRIGCLDGGQAMHDFPAHSAGPFGEDVHGPWLDKDAILARWLERGKGWFDLHATAL